MTPRSRSKPRPASCTERARRVRARGLSLLELVLFIAIVGIALAGVAGQAPLMAVFDQAVRGSADPLVRKQALAAAESLLTEVLLQPFTWCDPQDPANEAATPPTRAEDCSFAQDALGPVPGGETRPAPGNADPFDNVADYHGYSLGPGLRSLDGTAPPALADYSARVTVTRTGTRFGLADDGAALRVDVEVSGRGQRVRLTGYRFRHSPRATG